MIFWILLLLLFAIPSESRVSYHRMVRNSIPAQDSNSNHRPEEGAETKPGDSSWNQEAPRPRGRLLGPAEMYWQTANGPRDGQQEELIVGGRNATEHLVPSIVSIQVLTNRNVFHICGGTLATPRKVVTAAHCFPEWEDEPYQVVLGQHYLSRGNEHSQRILVVCITLHPEYDEKKKNVPRDVAVLTLDEDAKIIPGFVETMEYSSKLPAQLAGKDAFMVGWGVTDAKGPQVDSDVLKYSEQKILSDPECLAYWRSIVSGEVICSLGACGEGAGAACDGDSGGPLIDKSTNQQVGIISTSRINCDVRYPSGFVSIGNLLGWIRSEL